MENFAIWIKLLGLALGLTLEWYMVDDIMDIGNRIGKYLMMDDSFLTSLQRMMARVLVEMDIKEELYESIGLVMVGQKSTEDIN